MWHLYLQWQRSYIRDEVFPDRLLQGPLSFRVEARAQRPFLWVLSNAAGTALHTRSGNAAPRIIPDYGMR